MSNYEKYMHSEDTNALIIIVICLLPLLIMAGMFAMKISSNNPQKRLAMQREAAKKVETSERFRSNAGPRYGVWGHNRFTIMTEDPVAANPEIVETETVYKTAPATSGEPAEETVETNESEETTEESPSEPEPDAATPEETTDTKTGRDGYIVHDDIYDGDRFLEYEYQIAIQKNCEALGNIDYPLALAIADVESDFDPDAYSATKDVGLYQVNELHRPWMESLGYNIDDPIDNIAAGLLLISGHIKNANGDITEGLMRYNNGPGGMKTLHDKGIYETDYTKAVMAAYEHWKAVLAS